ncbi:MAG TPA: hypothetical protein VNW54_09480 [Granulicella sp.]|jgi:hypothetical protein|nr:hypothetical protein [Granulicella sp.]
MSASPRTIPLITIGARLPQSSLWTMGHLLIATTMAVVGLFSVLNWDSLVPDRRDVLVLAPLPIRTGTLFSAKLAAVGAALGLVLFSLNVFTGLIWPLLFSPKGGGCWAPFDRWLLTGRRSSWQQCLSSVFCLVLGVQGVATQLLSRQRYLRLSAWLQVAGFGLIVGLYFLEPSLETREALTAPENQRLLAYMPSYCFLGLFQHLNGSMSEEFSGLASRAWVGLAVVVCATGEILLISCLRTLRKPVEEADILPTPRRFVGWPRGERRRLRPDCHSLLQRAHAAPQPPTSSHRESLPGGGGAAVLAYLRTVLGDRGVIQGMRTGQMRVFVLSASLLAALRRGRGHPSCLLEADLAGRELDLPHPQRGLGWRLAAHEIPGSCGGSAGF